MKILHKYVFRVCYKNLLKSYVIHIFNDPVCTCGKISEFDKITGY